MQSAINRLTLATAVAALLAALLSLGAQFAGAHPAEQRAAELGAAPSTVPGMLSYQGRVLVGGAPFNGAGYFKFAIVNTAANSTYWSNDGSSTAGLTPTLAVTSAVNNGLFAILLGDTTLSGMTQPLSATVFASADRRLRIWFSTTNSGFTQLTPDQAFTSAPFAFNAQALAGLDASTFVQQSDLTTTGYITLGVADSRYARISPTTQQIAMLKWYTAISGTQADFGVGASPAVLAFDGANMWVANFNSGNVSVLRASDGSHVMTPTVGGGPQGIAFDGSNMWVANTLSNTVSVLRASDGSLIRTVNVGSQPRSIAFDGANMWVPNILNNNVSVLRASDGFPIVTYTVGSFPTLLAFDGVNMWVANSGDNTVSELRASDGLHLMTPTVGTNPRGVAFDGTNIWVVNRDSNNVSVLRASDGYHIMTPTVGLSPRNIAFDGANMWVTNANSGSVSVLRVSDGFPITTATVGATPIGLAFDGAFMWVSNAGGGSVSKR